GQRRSQDRAANHDWLAPIDPDAVHSWTLANLAPRIDAVERALGIERQRFLFTTPEQTLAMVHARTQIAIGRVVFISSLIVAVLLTFAAFAAAVERSDVAREDRRLRAAGASGVTRLVFVIAEALLPAVAGAILGELGAIGALAALASADGASPGVILSLA